MSNKLCFSLKTRLWAEKQTAYLIGSQVCLFEGFGYALKHHHLSLSTSILHVDLRRVLLDSCMKDRI